MSGQEKTVVPVTWFQRDPGGTTTHIVPPADQEEDESRTEPEKAVGHDHG